MCNLSDNFMHVYFSNVFKCFPLLSVFMAFIVSVFSHLRFLRSVYDSNILNYCYYS
jgi:hypothetical protein